MSIQEPIRVETPDALHWSASADVVVVGYGGAGAAAALQAREEGADVLAIDRFGGGGATGYSGGVIYAAGTAAQREAGIEDNAGEMYKYLKAENVPLKDETLRRFCEGSNGDMEWLAGHGVPYGGNAFLDKIAFPPDGYWLYYSGNENTDRFRKIAAPAPRGHRVMTPGNGGWLHHQRLREACEAKGVRLMTHAPASRLVLDRDGNVLGIEVLELPQGQHALHQKLYDIVDAWKPFNNVKAQEAIDQARELVEQYGQPKLVRAKNGVILATGGFINNLAMLAKYQPEVARSYKGLLRLGSAGCDGSGIELGMSAGGKTDRMERLFIGSPLSPPLSYVKGGILVNTRGERFTAEDAYHAEIGNDQIRQPGCKAWLILEASYFRKAMKESAFPGKGMFMTWGLPPLVNALLGGTKRAGTLEKLARKIGVDPDGLAATVEEFNATADTGGPDRFNKSPDKLHAIRKGPFYAVNFSVDNFWYPTMAFTLGGLVVDEVSGEVTREDGSVIKGLYAAGRSAVGICSQSYMSGLSIADTVFSGRRAGRRAASGGAAQAG